MTQREIDRHKVYQKRSLKGSNEIFGDPQLVPDRWSLSGWKYSQVDPSKANYFKNPNRVNLLGFTPSKYDLFNSKEQQSIIDQVTKNSKERIVHDQEYYKSSYTRHFKQKAE